MNSNFFCVADVGNTSVDIGQFESRPSQDPNIDESKNVVLPSPMKWIKLPVDAFVESEWLEPPKLARSKWMIGSVNQCVAERLQQHLIDHGAQVQVVDRQNFSLRTAIRNFDTVGIDRLASATAANRLRSPERAAIVVDAGSAITVDCVSHEGVFLGGMIAPGLRLCAQTLATNTNQLPKIEIPDAVPPMIGDETTSAIQAGVYWLVAAGIDGILGRLKQELVRPCDVFATGGSMPWLLTHFARHQPIHLPHLVLSGLAALHESR